MEIYVNSSIKSTTGCMWGVENVSNWDGLLTVLNTKTKAQIKGLRLCDELQALHPMQTTTRKAKADTDVLEMLATKLGIDLSVAKETDLGEDSNAPAKEFEPVLARLVWSLSNPTLGELILHSTVYQKDLSKHPFFALLGVRNILEHVSVDGKGDAKKLVLTKGISIQSIYDWKGKKLLAGTNKTVAVAALSDGLIEQLLNS